MQPRHRQITSEGRAVSPKVPRVSSTLSSQVLWMRCVMALLDCLELNPLYRPAPQLVELAREIREQHQSTEPSSPWPSVICYMFRLYSSLISQTTSRTQRVPNGDETKQLNKTNSSRISRKTIVYNDQLPHSRPHPPTHHQR